MELYNNSMYRDLKLFFVPLFAAIIFLFLVSPTFAHIIVYPSQVGIAKTQVFDISVPTEKDIPTVGLKLLIPQGLQDVLPNIQQGWTIQVVQNGGTVTEIDWTNGSIPPNERNDFYFQAQVPPTPTTLAWKAYQTYQDGTVVSWDVNPVLLQNLTDARQDQLAESENKGEYSTTRVVNDIKNSTSSSAYPVSTGLALPLLISIGAILISCVTLGLVVLRKK